MNTKKKFDFTTFIVILVSFGLILFGIYLLNKSFTKKTTLATNSNSSSRAKSNTTINYSSSIVTTQPSEYSTATSEKSISSKSSSNTSTISQNSLSSSSNKIALPLSKSEAKIKVLETFGGGSYEIEILETGLEKPIFWVKDKKLRINNSTQLNLGTEYRVSDITESSGSFSYDSILE
jgi:hypothetical protein